MTHAEKERKRIGASIAEERKRQGMTQLELEELTGIKQCHLSRIEQGRYSVGFDILQYIADALGADIRLVKR